MRIKDLPLTGGVTGADLVVVDQLVGGNYATRRTTVNAVANSVRTGYTFNSFSGVDPTGVSDSTTGMQAAIDFVAGLGGGNLYGAAGAIYRISAALVLKTGVQIDFAGATVKQYGTNIPIVTAPTGSICANWRIRNGRLEFVTPQDGLSTVQVNITGTIATGDRMLGLSSGTVGLVQSVAGGTVTFIGNGLFSSGESLQILGVVQGTTTASAVAVRQGVGIRLANGSFSYLFNIEDVTVVNAYDGISCPKSAGSFAFVGQIQNYTGADCHRWSMNIDCDTATGANTNLVLTNCWAIPSTASYADSPPFSSGFRFDGASQFQWQSLFADKIRGQLLFVQSSSGWFGNLSLEASKLEAFPNNEASAIQFSNTSASIEEIGRAHV